MSPEPINATKSGPTESLQIFRRTMGTLLFVLILATGFMVFPAAGMISNANFTAPWTELTGNGPYSIHQDSVALPDGSIVLMSGNSVWRSTDEGATWTEVNADTSYESRSGQCNVVMPDGSIVLMGGFGQYGEYLNDVWRSTDKGVTWTEVNASAAWSPRFEPSGVALKNGDLVILGGSDQNNSFGDVWRSKDYGNTWTLMNTSGGIPAAGLQDLVVLPDNSIVYLASSFVNGVLRSTDEGATWTLINANPAYGMRNEQCSVAETDGSILVMGGTRYDIDNEGNDVWRSTDKGATWIEVNSSAGWAPREMAACVVTPDSHVVIMGGGNFFTDTNYNDVWRLVPLANGKGNINVTSEPGGAEVIIDGSDTGHLTPWLFTNINPGSHNVTVSDSGYLASSKTVTVTAGNTTDVNFPLVVAPPFETTMISGKTEYTPGSPISYTFWADVNSAAVDDIDHCTSGDFTLDSHIENITTNMPSYPYPCSVSGNSVSCTDPHGNLGLWELYNGYHGWLPIFDPSRDFGTKFTITGTIDKNTPYGTEISSSEELDCFGDYGNAIGSYAANTVEVVKASPEPEFPSPVLPAFLIIAFLGTVLFIRRTGKR